MDGVSQMKALVFVASFIGALFVWWLMGFDFDRRGIEVGCGFIVCFLIGVIGVISYDIHLLENK